MGIISSAMLHSWEEMGCLDDNKSEELKTENIKLKKEIEQLKAENTKLKEEIRTEKIYSSQVEELEESLNHLKQENDNLKNKLSDAEAVMLTYKADIKELGGIIECKNGTIATLAKTRDNLKAENERLKEKIIRLSEENGNLIIRANTCESNYRDTQCRLNELCKANIHNLALLSKANKTLQEIKAIAENYIKGCVDCSLIAEPYECEDCTDCLLKQIVEKCKGELGRVRTIGKDIMAEEILKLLDIEECE